MRFRALNKSYAWMMGYFWIPCEVCEKPFGGHEVHKRITVTTLEQVPCPDCSIEIATNALIEHTGRSRASAEDFIQRGFHLIVTRTTVVINIIGRQTCG